MCFEADARPPAVPADRVLHPLAGGASAETLSLTSADGASFVAAIAECPDERGPGVIILPDVRGLYRFYIELAERFVTAGHHAIAIDYFGRTAGSQEREADFDFMAHLADTTPAQVQFDIDAARKVLAERTGAKSFVTVGFCFGGAQSFLAATNAELGLEAAIGFYGTLNARRTGLDFLPSPLEHAGQTRAPVLGLFGGDDELIPAEDISAFDELLDTSGVQHEVVTYPGAPHSFFDRSFSEHADASADAWRRVLSFLEPVAVAGGA
jgi:carboxymethylenebutenolidase